MADETTPDGESFFDPPTNGILTKDQDVDGCNAVSDLQRKIKDLELEKSDLLHEKEEQRKSIRLMAQEIDGLKENRTEMEGRLAELRAEVDRSEGDKKALLAIAARAADLETELFRLQHDFESSVSECEELRRKDLEKDSRIRDLEKVNASLIEEMEKSKAEMGIEIRSLREEAKILVSDMEKLEKVKEGFETLKESLELKLKKSEEKLKEVERIVEGLKQNNSEMEEKLTACEVEKAKIEKRILQLERELVMGKGTERSALNEGKGFKFGWPVAAASTGTIAVAVVLIYLRNANQR